MANISAVCLRWRVWRMDLAFALARNIDSLGR